MSKLHFSPYSEQIEPQFVQAERKNKLLRSVAGSGVEMLSDLRTRWDKFEIIMESHQLMIKEQVSKYRSNCRCVCTVRAPACARMYVCAYFCTREVTRLYCVYICTKVKCSTIQNVYIYIKLYGYVVLPYGLIFSWDKIFANCSISQKKVLCF